MARVDIARALQEARLAFPAMESDLHFRRLERELARELAELGVAPEARETGPLLDVGPRDQRFRAALAGHVRGDFDEKREAAHFRLRDESSLAARMSLQLWPWFGACEKLGITRIHAQREFIGPFAAPTGLQPPVLP